MEKNITPVIQQVLPLNIYIYNIIWIVFFFLKSRRRSHRLHRREYLASGPHHAWHIDSFSRYIIWLNIYNTNNNPSIVALQTKGQNNFGVTSGDNLSSTGYENSTRKIYTGDFLDMNLLICCFMGIIQVYKYHQHYQIYLLIIVS